MRTRPHGMYSQNESSSSTINQCTESHGKPLRLFSVATCPFLMRLSPPAVAAQGAIPIEAEASDLTLSQSICLVRLPDLSVLEINDATVKTGPDPHASWFRARE